MELSQRQAERAEELKLAYEHENKRIEALRKEAAQKREEEGFWNALGAIATVLVGTAAIICTAGAATPIVVIGAVSGVSTIAYGTSNLIESGQDIYYGAIGDPYTVAINPIRDTVFCGNQTAYDIWGGVSTTVSGLVIPVGQGITAAKAAGQTGKAMLGTVGKEVAKDFAQDAFVNAVSSGAGSAAMKVTGNANFSRAVSLASGVASGSKSGKVLNSLDDIGTSTVKSLNHLDDVADVSKIANHKSGKETVIYGTNDIANYKYNMIENPGPLAEIVDNPAKNFYGGRYNAEVLTEDKIFYRGGNSKNPMGQWFTTKPPESVAKVRIDTAVKPQWIDPITGELTGESVIDTAYAIKVPKGTSVYTGPVGSQGGACCGGYNKMQTFIETPWDIDGIEVVGKKKLK